MLRDILVETLKDKLAALYVGKAYKGRIVKGVSVYVEKRYIENPNGADFEYDRIYAYVYFEDSKDEWDYVELDLDDTI